MSYRLELFSSPLGKTISLSHEEIRPSSLIIPSQFAIIALQRARNNQPAPGTVLDSGLIIPSEEENFIFGSMVAGPGIDLANSLDSEVREDLTDFFDYTYDKTCELLDDGHDGVAVSLNPDTLTPGLMMALSSYRERITAYVNRATVPDDAPAPGMYL